MKLKVDVQRIIHECLTDLPASLNSEEILGEIELTMDIEPTKRFSYLDEKYEKNWTITIFRKIWRKIELIRFLKTTYSIYQGDPVKINFKGVRRLIKNVIPNNDRLITIEISANPQIIMIAQAYDKFPTIMDKLAAPAHAKDVVYWIPKSGLLLSKLHEDAQAEKFFESLQQHVTGKLTQVRLRSMELTKYYMRTKKITNVKISTVFEITGFGGLDYMEMKGTDIKKGVYGLQQRQEIDIRGLGGLGPNVEIGCDNIHLYIGSKINLKALAGIDILLEIIDDKE